MKGEKRLVNIILQAINEEACKIVASFSYVTFQYEKNQQADVLSKEELQLAPCIMKVMESRNGEDLGE